MTLRTSLSKGHLCAHAYWYTPSGPWFLALIPGCHVVLTRTNKAWNNSMATLALCEIKSKIYCTSGSILDLFVLDTGGPDLVILDMIEALLSGVQDQSALIHEQ